MGTAADAWLYYTTYGYWPVWYTGYHGYGGYHYLGKRSAVAEPEADAKPEGKSDADAWIYYTTYGYWPAWYTGYHGDGGYHYLGKRSADAKPEGKSDADAWLYYTTYGYCPLGTLGTMDMADIIILAKEVLTLNQKENLKPMPTTITTPMDTGQLGIMATTTGVKV